MREESGKYEIQYKGKIDGDKTEYKLKYEDGKEYEFESEYDINGISEDKLKIKVDLVSYNGLSPYLKNKILNQEIKII